MGGLNGTTLRQNEIYPRKSVFRESFDFFQLNPTYNKFLEFWRSTVGIRNPTIQNPESF